MKTLVSGVQPTGKLTLGNYLGSIKNWAVLQSQYESFLFIADLHAITVPAEPMELYNNSIMTAATYIACGVDPKKSSIFPQSSITYHPELSWILSCITSMGIMNRMTQFKDKAGKDKEKASLGLYNYPVLMAADILIYKAEIVPVGEDQKQHLELTRDIAQNFNRITNNDFFPIPEVLIVKETKRIMSLRDGKKKMSKSDPSDFSRINLIDENDLIAQKIKKATSDNFSEISFDQENRPEISNLLTIHSSLLDQPIVDSVRHFQNSSTKLFKDEITQVIIEKIGPIRDEVNKLINNLDYLDSILSVGVNKARERAFNTIEDVKKIMGFFSVSNNRKPQ